MAFTDHSPLFASIHERALNRFFDHTRRQRPSLFNYATNQVATHSELLCQVIEPNPIVGVRANPLVTLVDPLPIPGTDYGINYAVQISAVKVDFHPASTFALPPELAPLGPQRLGIRLKLCVGLGCPPKELVDRLTPPPTDRPVPEKGRGDTPAPKTVIPISTKQLTCFCLEVFLVGGVRHRDYSGQAYIEPFADSLEIVDVKPEGLESALECYALLLLKLAVLPGLRLLLEDLTLDLMGLATVTLRPTPAPSQVAHNPAIEQDLLKLFVDMEVS